jgi:hypothetical protein
MFVHVLSSSKTHAFACGMFLHTEEVHMLLQAHVSFFHNNMNFIIKAMNNTDLRISQCLRKLVGEDHVQPVQAWA